MADLKLNSQFDLDLKDGDLKLCESLEDSLMQGGRVAIKTRKGDNVFHEEYGNSLYSSRVKISNNPLAKQCCIDAIISSSDLISSVEQLIIHDVGTPNDVDCSFSIRLATIIDSSEDDEEVGDINDIDNELYDFV